jgi:hypothetical protein
MENSDPNRLRATPGEAEATELGLLDSGAMGGVALGEIAVSYLDEPLAPTRLDPSGTSERLSPEDEVTIGLRATLLKQRNDVLALPSDEEGLRMDRVHAFRESVGAPNKVVRVLSPADYRQALILAGKDPNRLAPGKYLELIDVIIVRRDPELEALNGPEFTESIVVHELVGHGSNQHHDLEVTTQTRKGRFGRREASIVPRLARLGLMVATSEGSDGTALEEGFAEYERGLYVANVLGRPEGFAEGYPADNPVSRYTHLERAGDGGTQPALFEGAITAVILHEIISRNPDLLTALRKARHSEVAVEAVAEYVNDVVPGLYQELFKVNVKDRKEQDKIVKMLHQVRAA